jgi:hypothetical protein
MERSRFASRLAESSRVAVELARRLIRESLPDTVRFCVYPEDSQSPQANLARVDLETLVALLWRDGAVPEWVNLSVEAADAESVIVGVTSCGRFTTNEALLYHEREGRRPFHVLGPALPPDWRGEGDRFSLWWTAHARNRDELTRVADHAHEVKILVVRGSWCDDTTLALVGSFPQLATLRLEHTAVVGTGLAHLVARSPLEHLALTGLAGGPVDLSAVGELSTLRTVAVDGEPTEILGANKLVALVSLTDLTLDLRALTSLELARGLGSLARLSAKRSSVSSLAPLRECSRLEHLALDQTNVSDDQLAHVAPLKRLRTLSLNGTAVTDRALQLLASARPDLRIVASGWSQPPRRKRPDAGE